MEADFSGYATKAGLKCTDGRTIQPNAFQHQDGLKVPLVWQHGHDDVKHVLGHAILENREDGVYAYGYFNDTDNGKAARMMVQHGDITMMSIYAGQLVERAKQVLHGAIKEVSLVLSGANPGAKIQNVRIAHSDGEIESLEDEAIIFTGLSLEHSESEPEEEEEEEEELVEEVVEPEEEVQHADEDESIKDVYETLNDKQKDVVHYMIGAAIEASDDNAKHADDNDTEGDLNHQEGSTNMSRNVFEGNDAGAQAGPTLSHSDLVSIVQAGQQSGSFKEALLAHAAEYGITDINLLFPDAKALMQQPDFISRRMEWVASVLDGTKHSPFAKVKTIHADITEPEARAKGYIKGTRKKEEVFKLLKRTTSPATIYKKQKLDRDDVLDITDIDVIAWLKAEMRLMIEEELARAILVGDGRSTMSEDKVKDPEGAVDGTGIRSILHDDDLYVIKKEIPSNVSSKNAVKAIIRATDEYRGSGQPVMYTSRSNLTELLLDEDKFGRPMYADKRALADKLGVRDIIPVDLFTEYQGLFAIVVSLQDYTIGSNKGGELTSFEDFDIDFNQHKYLQETRLSGGLTKPFSAIVITKALGTAATATAPSFDGETNTITIPTVTGVVYTIDGEVVDGDVEILEMTEVKAEAADGYYLPSGTTRDWTYTP